MQFDFHIHSTFSNDSILSPEKIVREAKKKELDGIAVTDHNTIKGSLYTKAISNDLLVIRGAEIKTDICDLIGLFLTEEIKSRKFKEVLDEIKAQDGVTVLPHPFRVAFNIPLSLLHEIDLIEVVNARNSRVSNNKAYILAKDLGKKIIAGSDAHTSFEIGRVRTILSVDDMGEESVRKSLLNGSAILKGSEYSYCIRKLNILTGKVIKKINFRK